MQEPQSPQLRRLATGPLTSPRCPVGNSHRRSVGKIWHAGNAGITSLHGEVDSGTRTVQGRVGGQADFLLPVAGETGLTQPHPRAARRCFLQFSYSAAISPTRHRHNTPKKWLRPLARSLELCKCRLDRTARLSNFSERPVSPDAFHTPIRLARLSLAETEGWGLIEPE